MNQAELRDLLLSMAAEASVAYDRALFDRNSKFNEVSLTGKRLDELKEQSRDALFSPRNNLSSYDTRLSLEQEYEKLKLELAELDSICDSRLNRKEELLEGVELFDSILEEREEYLSMNKDVVSSSSNYQSGSANQSVSDLHSLSEDQSGSNVQSTINLQFGSNVQSGLNIQSGLDTQSSSDAQSDFDDVSNTPAPDTEELKKVISYLAHQCGEIADHTILDPYRARNELRGICVKWGD